jgi:hypothetical protein
MDLELKSDLETGDQVIKLVAGETMCKLVRVLCDQYQYNSVRRECWAIDIYTIVCCTIDIYTIVCWRTIDIKTIVCDASAGRSISI